MLNSSTVLARAIDTVRIHRVRRETRDGRAVWTKYRRRGMDGVIACGNVFLDRSRSRIRMFRDVAAWQWWEVASFGLLNGDAYGCGPLGPRGFWAECLPGVSLRELCRAGTIDTDAARAAGAELRRAHALSCAVRGVLWSHGDPHLGNVLYDAAAGRARLIDFETIHDATLPAAERHADDLLVFLLELLATVDAPRWPALGMATLAAYDRPEPLEALRLRLRVPRGLELVLWRTRSAHTPLSELERRISQLRNALA
jgi:hypothetical protein